MAKLLVSITHAKDNTDKATVGFVIANASMASDVETVVFLSTEGVRLCSRGYADDIQEPGFRPLTELMAEFVEAGGRIWACSPCFSKRGLDPGQLIDGATVVGGVVAVEFLSSGAASLTY